VVVTERDESSGVDSRLYPEIAGSGDLATWLTTAFEEGGLPYRPCPRPDVVGRWRSALVEDDERSTDVILSSARRQIVMRLLANGSSMASALIPNLPAVVAITHLWQSGALLRNVATAWPYFGSVELAEARERGDVAEHRWRMLYENPFPVYDLGALRAFIDVAFRTPRLRALIPLPSGLFTVIKFASTTGEPYGADGPSVRSLSKDLYLVRGSDGRERGVADAAGSVALVLANLDEAADGPNPR
jgi:hypothetical protein